MKFNGHSMEIQWTFNEIQSVWACLPPQAQPKKGRRAKLEGAAPGGSHLLTRGKEREPTKAAKY